MAIQRKLVRIEMSFAPDGTPNVTATAVVTDTDEGTSTGAGRTFTQGPVFNAAVALRDAVVAVAQNAGKPVTF